MGVDNNRSMVPAACRRDATFDRHFTTTRTSNYTFYAPRKTSSVEIEAVARLRCCLQASKSFLGRSLYRKLVASYLLLFARRPSGEVDLLYGPKDWPSPFSYNSAESEPIWMKFGILWAKCCGLALADFKRDPHSIATVWEAAEILFFVCLLSSARFQRFSVRNILRHFNTTTSICEAMKTFGTEFWKY